MKNKLPELVLNFLKKYKIYHGCCDICNIKCCDGTTTFQIDGVTYSIDQSGVTPELARVGGTPAPTPCIANISELHMDGKDVVIEIDDTTAGGYLTLDIAGTPFPQFPNPSDELPAIDFIESLRTGGETITMNRSNTMGGLTCATSFFTTYSDSVIVPPVVGTVSVDLNVLFSLPACTGTLAFYELYTTNTTGITTDINGTVTIPAQAVVADSYYYVYVRCDNTLIATVALLLVD